MNFGIDTYITEKCLNSTDNIARIIQKNKYIYTIVTGTETITKVKIASSVKNAELYVGDFIRFYWKDEEC